MSVSAIKALTGAEDKDGNIPVTLKFKIPSDSDELDQWFYFCKNHPSQMDFEVFGDGGLSMKAVKEPPLPDGQTTLEIVDEEDDDDEVL